MKLTRSASVALASLTALTTSASLLASPAYASAQRSPSGAFVPLSATANLIRNGAFVNPPFTGGYDFIKPGSKVIPGWSVGGGGVSIYGNGDVQPPPGAPHLVRLAWVGSGDIEQTVATTPGWTYLVKYWLGGQPGGQPIKTLHVFWDNALAAAPSCNTTGTSNSHVGWTLHRVAVTAKASSSELEFADASRGYNSMVGSISMAANAALSLPPSWTLKGTSGSLVAYVRSLSGTPITDPALKARLYGTWKPQSYAPLTTKQLAVAVVKGGQATLTVHLPSSLAGKTITATVTLSGPQFITVTRTFPVHVG